MQKKMWERLSELAKESKCCIITATQISPTTQTFRESAVREDSGIVIVDYIDLIKENS